MTADQDDLTFFCTRMVQPLLLLSGSFFNLIDRFANVDYLIVVSNLISACQARQGGIPRNPEIFFRRG
jgi:hypothetical protein